MIADVIVDLQYGDCGKGKIAHALCRDKDYTHVIRYNGGCNAGHTIYHEGVKFVTHHIPCGVFFGIKSIIGPGCVVHVDTFLQEIKELENAGIPADDLVHIATNAHIITDFHRIEDGKDEEIGTTKRGNGPAYRDKYGRRGVRAVEDPRLSKYLVNMYQELYENDEFEEIEVLFEGAQGFGLDVDWGDYPFVTSSHCTVGSAILNGVPPRSIRDIWGVAKIYETYVGAKSFEGPEDIFEEIRELGQEYGATTGRPRQVNWMDFDMLKMASRINGINKLVINKMDILDEIDVWRAYSGPHMLEFSSRDDMEFWIQTKLQMDVNEDMKIYFSGDKEHI
jgi:adenylosuccinate synthase|tara:strand:+ start:217 stop:1224 length:1008 start_codon:yes stop_codon:yes gene_type:complete